MARRRDLGRARLNQAARKQSRAAARWDPEWNNWHKYIACDLCRRRWVCNNNPQRKPRIYPGQVLAGKKVCLWCLGRHGKFFVQLMLIAERVAKDNHAEIDPTCKCTACVAHRILKAHKETPVTNLNGTPT